MILKNQMKLVFFGTKTIEMISAVTLLEVIGLKNKIVILMSSTMTERQKEKAQTYSKIRVGHVLRAIDWLVVNNQQTL